ncbi:MAG: hypothetical protein ACR652_09055 [Methylocystis sp.]|uniref:hypothetical protein n=1 Tax=Methylocystis sp. TaxID=1911079 RepID=UPI003DA528AA
MTRETWEAFQRWLASLPPDVVAKARELCAVDGHDPDGRIEEYGANWMVYVEQAEEALAAAASRSDVSQPELVSPQPLEPSFWARAAQAVDRHGMYYMCFALFVGWGIVLGADILGYGPQAYIGGPIGGLIYFFSMRGGPSEDEESAESRSVTDHVPPPVEPEQDGRSRREHRHRSHARRRRHEH